MKAIAGRIPETRISFMDAASDCSEIATCGPATGLNTPEMAGNGWEPISCRQKMTFHRSVEDCNNL